MAEPETTPPPTFDVLPLSSEVRKAIDDLGYVHPTPVQRAVYEPATRGKDLVVQARTGTGKTAAFALPLVDNLVKRGTAAVQALVLCPTRELALQVTREMEALAKYRGVKCAAVYGGAPMPRQVEAIRQGAQVVVGTPGRVLDHLRRKTFMPKDLRTVVLDESDEMLSMGFLPQITDIFSFLPENRQTLLFSATLPPDIRRMAESKLRSPEFITLSGDHVGALSIKHFVYLCQTDKVQALIQILETEDPESAVVFCNTKDETKRVAGALQQQGYESDWLNADLAQNEREKVMSRTRKGELRFLVATDVAARGIDISHLTHVVNFDFPESAENYLHRTGRTGRAGRTGTAISLIEPGDVGNLYLLRLTYKLRPIERQLPSARELKTRQEADVLKFFADGIGKRKPHPDDLALARRLLTHELGETIIAGLLRDHLGARPDVLEEAKASRRARPPTKVQEPGEVTPGEATPVKAAPPTQTVLDRPLPEPAAERRDEARREEPRRDESRQVEPRREEPRRDESRQVEPRREEPRRDESRRRDGSRQRDDRARGRFDGDRPRRRERDLGDDALPKYTVAVMPEAVPEAELPPKVSNGRQAEQTAALAEIAGDEAAIPSRDSEEALEGESAIDPNVAEIYVNVGRRDGAKPSDYQAALEGAGVGSEGTGYIRVRHRHAFVGVRHEFLDRALDALNGATIAGKRASAEPAKRP
jgi:ATP-dependent RNA helicase DeaD